MGRARSAIAVRTTVEKLQGVLSTSLSASVTGTETHEDFYDAVDYCRSNSGEFAGEEGSESWYFWQVGDWAIAGDITMRFCQNQEGLEAISRSLGETVVAAVDTSFQYAFFALIDGGETRRLLILEDDEIIDEGFPIAAERGRHLDDFEEEEAERLWTSYGLPTFEHDPTDGPFTCVAVQSKD